MDGEMKVVEQTTMQRCVLFARNKKLARKNGLGTVTVDGQRVGLRIRN
jgi:hypothetical protein